MGGSDPDGQARSTNSATTGKIMHPYRSRKSALSGITSFCWFQDDGPSSDGVNRVLTCGYDGRLESMAMYNTSTAAVSASNGEVVFTSNSQLYTHVPFADGVATQMQRLAREGYGLNADKNVSLLSKLHADPGRKTSPGLAEHALRLKNVWVWLQKCKALQRVAGQGVFDLLGVDSIAGFNDGQRETAMKMCGWVGAKQMNRAFLARVASTSIDRAIALAILYGDIEGAVQLIQDHQDNLRSNSTATTVPVSVRIALAGYQSTQTSAAGLWYGMAREIVDQLNDFPYIQWAFRVLLDTSELASSALVARGGAAKGSGGNKGSAASLPGMSQLDTTESPFNELGNAENPRYTSMGSAISMTDRIALACRFLPKGNLIMYLKRLYLYAAANSEIEGLILVGCAGLSRRGNTFGADGGMRLLQNYIGHTGDVQSAALVLGFVGNLSLLEDRLGQEIVAGYRDLLNRWEMFRERARFDCDRANIERSVGSMNGQGIPSKTKPYVPKWIMKSQLSVSSPLFFSILFHWPKCTSKTNHIVLYAKGSLRLLQRVVFDTDDNTKRERLPAMACAREKCNPSMPKLQAWPAKVLRLPLDSWKQQPIHHIRDKTEELVRRQGQGEKRRERVARRSRKKLLKRR